MKSLRVDEMSFVDPKLVIRFEPRLESLPDMLDRLGAYAAVAGLSSRVAFRLAMVCEELAANIAMHGAGGADGATFVEIVVDRRDDGLSLSIEDDGQPFDPLNRAGPDVELGVEDRPIGGLGIHFVRSLVKDISYRRLDRVNRLTAVVDTAN